MILTSEQRATKRATLIAESNRRDTAAERDRLLAANAELVEALAQLEKCHITYCNTYGPGMDKENASCMKGVRAILAKAKESTP